MFGRIFQQFKMTNTITFSHRYKIVNYKIMMLLIITAKEILQLWQPQSLAKLERLLICLFNTSYNQIVD